MTEKSDFHTRLARIEAKRPPSAPVEPAQQSIELHGGPVRVQSGFRLALLSTAVGLLLMGGAIGWVWDDIAILFPRSEDGQSRNFLETTLRERMTEEKLERMNADPKLEGMTDLQKMILSH